MIHVPEATARELMNLSTENEDQVNILYLETIETLPPYVLPNQTIPNRTTENEDQVYIWKQLKRCHPMSDFDSLAVASRPLGCLHLQRVEAGIKSPLSCFYSILTFDSGKG